MKYTGQCEKFSVGKGVFCGQMVKDMCKIHDKNVTFLLKEIGNQ